ncbi:hypothetical protein EYB53_025250, partial [Candidatus Chloroploca sp. M-50]
SLNRYLYVQANPLNYTDPLGLFATGISASTEAQYQNIKVVNYGTASSWCGKKAVPVGIRSSSSTVSRSLTPSPKTSTSQPSQPTTSSNLGTSTPVRDMPTISINRKPPQSAFLYWIVEQAANIPLESFLRRVSAEVEVTPQTIFNLWKHMRTKTLFKRDLTPSTLREVRALNKKFSVYASVEVGVGITPVDVALSTTGLSTKLCIEAKLRGETGVSLPLSAVIVSDIYGTIGAEATGCIKFSSDQGFEPFEPEVNVYGGVGLRVYAEIDVGIAGGRVGARGEARLEKKWNNQGVGVNLYLEIAPFYGYKYWGRSWEDHDLLKFTGSIPVTN